VHVQVRHALADAVVHRHERARRTEAALDRPGDPLHPGEQGAEQVGWHVGQRLVVVAGHHQRVPREQGPQVEEGQDDVVVEHHLARCVTSDDRTEDASVELCHGGRA
jgi:hypothetical protein